MGGTQDDRITDLMGNSDRSIHRGGRAIGRLSQAQTVQKLLKALSIFGAIDTVGGGAKDVDTGVEQRHRQVKRSLSAKLHDHPFRLLDIDDVEHIFNVSGSKYRRSEVS